MNILIIIIAVYVTFIFVARYLDIILNKLYCTEVYLIPLWLLPAVNVYVSVVYIVLIIVKLVQLIFIDNTKFSYFLEHITRSKFVKWFTCKDR